MENEKVGKVLVEVISPDFDLDNFYPDGIVPIRVMTVDEVLEKWGDGE